MSLRRKKFAQSSIVMNTPAKKNHSRTKVGIEERRIHRGWPVMKRSRKRTIQPRGSTLNSLLPEGGNRIINPVPAARMPIGTRAAVHFRMCSD